MKKPALIGLNGPARSGKDTTADMIMRWCAEHSVSVARHGFADKLKESAAHSLGVFEDEIAFCNTLKEDGEISVTIGEETRAVYLSGREYLQYYGTEAHRDVFGYNFWVDSLLPMDVPPTLMGQGEPWIPSASELNVEYRPLWWQNFGWKSADGYTGGNPAEVCIVTDCRFDNEAQRVLTLGGEIWRIERDGSGAGSAGKEGHASEQELPGEYISLIIDNNGTLDDLATTVDAAMEEVTKQVVL